MAETKTATVELQELTKQMRDILEGQKEMKSLKDFSGETKGQLDKINTRMSEIEAAMNRKAAVVPESQKDGAYTPEEVEHKELFMNYLRKNAKFEVPKKVIDSLPEAQKAMSTDSDPDGGYLVPHILQNTIIERVRDHSPVRQVANVVNISIGNEYIVPVEKDTDVGFGWVGERGTRTETDAPKYDKVTVPLYEMYAMPALTSAMLADPLIDIESFVNNRVSDKFVRAEGSAFISGDGSMKPKGILASDKVTNYSGTLGSTDQIDALMMMQAQLYENFQLNANWMMNRLTLAYVRTLKSQDGAYLWQPSVQAGTPPMILGKPYIIADHMPDAVDSSLTLISGNVPIVYGDFREGYTIVDKNDMTMLRDPYTNKGFILYYTTKRVGGDVVNDQALVKLTLE